MIDDIRKNRQALKELLFDGVCATNAEGVVLPLDQALKSLKLQYDSLSRKITLLTPMKEAI